MNNAIKSEKEVEHKLPKTSLNNVVYPRPCHLVAPSLTGGYRT